MKRVLVSLLLVLSVVALYGCTEVKLPSWLQAKKAKPAAEKESQVEQPVGTVLASINERIITLEDFNGRIQAYNSEIEASADIPDSIKDNYLIKSVEDKERLLEGMAERELLIAEAIERGLDRDRDVAEAVKALKEQLLFAKIIESEKTKVKVSAEEVENYYNLYRDVFAIPEERKVSMIVVPQEEKAKEVLISLLQGADFADLARANSTDAGAANGGDIGFIVQTSPFPQPGKKQMFKKFEEIAFSLELNKPSTVFHGPDGYYIVKVTEIKEAHQRMLSDVYSDIEQGLLLKKQDEALQTLVGNLRKSANIIVHDELLKE